MKLKMNKPSLQMAGTHVRSNSASAGSERKRSGSGWKRTRASVLQRDTGLCCECTRNGWLRQAAEVDHITALQFGGSDDESNLQGLCTPCHRVKTRREAQGHPPSNYWSGVEPDAI